jgi:hypothetical protein
VFETEAEAIAQCRHWTAKVHDLHEALVHPGYVYWAQYGTADDTVRVEAHLLTVHDTEAPSVFAAVQHLAAAERALQEDGYAPQSPQ